VGTATISDMTNIHNLRTTVEAHAIAYNKVRFDEAQIKVKEKKSHITVLSDRILPGWHYGVPNDFCVFIDTLDNDHCAAYVYVLTEECADVLKLTLVISDEDGAQPPARIASLEQIS
jgi:hypothetical protein